MKKLKKKYQNKTLAGNGLKPFYTSDITTKQIEFYCRMGFEFIFEVVKEKKEKND